MDSFITEFLRNPIGQGFGILAMCISIFGYAQKNDKTTIKVFICSNTVWILHFYFMGIYSAMASCFVAIARSFLSLKYKRNKKIFFGIISAILVLGIITYEGKLSLLPIIASCISAYGFFFLERIRLRMFLFVSSVCRLTFSIGKFSIGGIISDTIVQIVSIITMYKMIRYEGERVYFVDKIIGILKKPDPDIGRFTFIRDYLKMKHNGIKNFFKNIYLKIIICYKKAKSTKIYLFKDRKLIKIEKEELST